MRHRIALAILTTSRVGGVRLRRNRTHTDRAAHDLRSRVADGVSSARSIRRRAVQLRRLRTRSRRRSRNGAPADIFASAAPLNTQRLFGQGLVDKPVTFTSNRLALDRSEVESRRTSIPSTT